MKLIRIFTAFVALLACDAFGAAGIIGRRAPTIRVNKWITPNPPTKTNLEGRVYVVEFWATWCGPCVEVVPHIIELADKYRDRGVLFIGLSKDKSIEQVRDFVDRKKINYHIGMDDGISKKFLFRGIPTCFVISHTGRVAWRGRPSGRDFEAAIVSALQTAPPLLLAGVEMGPFEDLRTQLSGGRGFLRAYRRLKIETRKGSYENSKIAREIIKETDTRINKKIGEAAAMRESNPAAAFKLYRQIVKNYRGIELIKPAVAAHDELKNNTQVKNELAADGHLRRAERLLAKCRGCQRCGDFSSGCKQCVRLNGMMITQAERILTRICRDYKGTKAAKTAQELLKELNSEALQAK